MIQLIVQTSPMFNFQYQLLSSPSFTVRQLETPPQEGEHEEQDVEPPRDVPVLQPQGWDR